MTLQATTTGVSGSSLERPDTDPALGEGESEVAGGGDKGTRTARAPHSASKLPGLRHVILVVEDDRNIGNGLRRALEGEGYEVHWVTDGSSALEVASARRVDLVVLDLYLPDIDGVEVCHQLRQSFPGLPILILSARTDEIDIVVGLDAGADDYMVKPFRLAEFLARLRAHLRRRPGTITDEIVAGDVQIDVGGRRVFVAGHEIPLRPKEFELLTLLASEVGRAVSRERIMADVWEVASSASTKTLDMHVSSLRRKLMEGGSTTRITTIRGAGYRLDP
ncbi:MAG: response regulator transcription factor [Actinomycetota bacterium]|nr:response regulator transcription factor [Actinomycetota bacterium]